MTEIRKADSKGRVTIPSLANATLIVDQIHETEFRIRKAVVIPERDLKFPEDESKIELSERDAKRFLEVMRNPPAPNRAAKKAAKEYKEYLKQHGRTVDHRKAR
jgi:hypothetical protein